jgi:hypothetical protein
MRQTPLQKQILRAIEEEPGIGYYQLLYSIHDQSPLAIAEAIAKLIKNNAIQKNRDTPNPGYVVSRPTIDAEKPAG